MDGKRPMVGRAAGLLVLALTLVPWTALPAWAAKPGDVVINEFATKGTEWVELHNPSGEPIDITGWKLTDGEAAEFLSGTIAAGGYFVIDTALALSNDGDEIQLLDEGNALIDEVAYGAKGGAPMPPFGTSSARSPNGADTGDFARDWNVDQTPSPGAANELPGTDLGSSIVINEQGAFSPEGSSYELYNPTGQDVDLAGWQASDGDDIRDLSGTIVSGGFLTFSNLSISADDVLYLWNADGVRVDQLGRVPEYEDDTFQRIPDGVGPNDGYDFPSSGGNVTYFDCTATAGTPNGTAGCISSVPTPRTIPEIQGPGLESPYVGELISTGGVVTSFTSDRAGFWLQDPVGDGEPKTSDGIFVHGGADLAPSLAVGDAVQVTAVVREYRRNDRTADLTRTELDSVSGLIVLSSGNPQPAPIELAGLPVQCVAAGIAFWEPREGMLVSVHNAPVVGPTSGHNEFAILAEADGKPGSGFYPETQQILLRGLGQNELGQNVVDYNPERILVGDSTLDGPLVVMPGDRVHSLVGAVDYASGNYKLQPASLDVEGHSPPNLPVSTRSGPRGDTVITTFNLEDLFDRVDNPGKKDTEDQLGAFDLPSEEELDTQLTKLAMAIRIELESPEIIVVQEVENTEILQALGDRVNAAAGAAYTATSFETSDVGGIEVGFLWDANRVDLLHAEQMPGPDVEAWFGPDSPSPGREPLVGAFEIEGREITIIGNHFKSKSGDDPLFGTNDPPLRGTEHQRKGQARTVRNFVNGILDVDPDALVMVTGDLNDFPFGEPGEGPDHPLAILEGGPGEVPLTNLVDWVKDDERFTYVYEGNSEVLDHMLVSPALLDLFVAVDALHFNASFPANLARDPGTTLRASDHDPLEGRFNFR
jgi:hypothetical protein